MYILNICYNISEVINTFIVLASETCPPLRETVTSAVNDGTVDVTALLADELLTSLNDQVNNFNQNINNGDVTSEEQIERFVAELSDSLNNDVITGCGLNAELGLDVVRLKNLIGDALEVILQDLTQLFSCTSIESFLSNEIVLRIERANFSAITFLLTASGANSQLSSSFSAFDLDFHSGNVQDFVSRISQLSIFF